MALTIAGGGGGGGAWTLQGGSTNGNSRRPILFPPSSSNSFFGSLQFTARNTNIVAKAAKKLSSRTGKFDSKNRRSLSTTTKEEEKEQRTVQIETDDISRGRESVDVSDVVGDDGYFLPELPGDKPDPFEGSQWDVLGFVVQYLWAFGIVFALIACGIAVATYNEGAADFKQTPAYKESIQSRELLEEPEGASSDVFESNPTEEAPSLE